MSCVSRDQGSPGGNGGWACPVHRPRPRGKPSARLGSAHPAPWSSRPGAMGATSRCPRRPGAWKPGNASARARRRCPRLPDNAAAPASSPRTAPACSVASGCSQSSSQHSPGGGLIPPRGQLRATQRGKSPWGPVGSGVGNGAWTRGGDGAGRNV